MSALSFFRVDYNACLAAALPAACLLGHVFNNFLFPNEPTLLAGGLFGHIGLEFLLWGILSIIKE
jgi:hypothetical protein